MHTNRLAQEKSPYLLQHAHNPVDWFAWNDAAFARARTENKPIFLSIGYSTCHWCHVMERESFEQEAIGKFLNEHFVSIKVDREERPDVDKIYMTFVQSTTGSGGWPMSVFLTPDLKPFFGGTYFPPDARHGRPSFIQLLQHISQLWRDRREEIIASAGEIHARLELQLGKSSATDTGLEAEVIRHAGLTFKAGYDARHGGFGGAPKFPQPSIPSLVLRYAKRFNDAEAVQMVLHTCDVMAAGGIHDQLGGGFARYAVDAEWLVPHFEKMLYDNAQLTQLYLDALLISGEERHAAVVRDILDYVMRDLTHPDGGFYSAEDADSEGQEGKFYCWTQAELSQLLTVEEFNVAAKYFGITAAGNFVDHSHPEPLPGLNVLSVIDPDKISRRPVDKLRDQKDQDYFLLQAAKKKMLAVRAKRVRPHLDDKILASWNGLMLGAFARAYAVIGDETYRAAAEKNLAFIREKLWIKAASTPALSPALSPGEREKVPPSPVKTATDFNSINSETNESSQPLSPLPEGEGQGEGAVRKQTGTLFHRWRDGERDSVQLLEAYAFLLSGVIELYEATLQPQHLDFAIELAGTMLAKFYDAENGGFWQSAADAGDLILRVKDDYDGAEPSGNSVATLALLKLGAITGQKNFTGAGKKTLGWFGQRLQHFPQALPFLLHAADFSLQEPARVVVAGDPRCFQFDFTGADENFARSLALLHAAHSVYQPNKIILGHTGAVEEFARTLPAKNEALVYICTGNTCQPPTSDAAKLKEKLK